MPEGPPTAKPSPIRIILLGMTVVPWIILSAVGVRLLIGNSALMGFVLLGLGSVTLVLSVRRVRAELLPRDPAAGLSTAEFDYLTWTMFAAPMVLVVLLLVLLVAGLRPT